MKCPDIYILQKLFNYFVILIYMNISVEINPFNYVTDVKIISRIEVHVFSIVLFESVTVMVTLCDDKDHVIDNKHIVISGDEYVMWSNDDSYLIDLVLTKLGLSKKSVVVPEEYS